MAEHAYGMNEIVGSSTTSIDDAIRMAIRKAGEAVRHIEWFEVSETRGHVIDGEVAYFQVKMKVGFRLDD